MSFADEGKARRILALVRSGVDTAADIEVELNFTMTRKQIAGHLSNLKKAGKIQTVGFHDVLTDGVGKNREAVGHRTAHRYALTRGQET